MDDYLQIRLLHRDGLSARKIARRLRCGRDTIRKALLNASPPGYVKSAPRVRPKLTEAFQSAIFAILKEDESAPRKQRHKLMRVFTRLREEQGYAGKCNQARRNAVNILSGCRAVSRWSGCNCGELVARGSGASAVGCCCHTLTTTTMNPAYRQPSF